MESPWVKELIIPGKFVNPLGWKASYMRIDIANPELKIAVEVDGNSHKLKKNQINDRLKDKILNELGWNVLRFKNEEVFDNVYKCLEEIECLMG